MNPFLLPGPLFLGCYLLFGAVLLGILYWSLVRGAEGGAYLAPKLANDPYRIAYLRGGAPEAIKIATIALIDRDMLEVRERSLCIKHHAALQSTTHPLEQEVLRRYLITHPILLRPSPVLNQVCKGLHGDLVKDGLLPSAAGLALRWLLAIFIVACLLAATMFKMQIALEHGRTNVIFLIIETGIFCYLAIAMTRQRQTARGVGLLRDLRTLFQRLASRPDSLRPGVDTHAASLLAAVFGEQQLPLTAYPFLFDLYQATYVPIIRRRRGSSSWFNFGGGNSGSCGGGCGGCGS